MCRTLTKTAAYRGLRRFGKKRTRSFAATAMAITYEQYRSNLPASASEVVIDGGCHAGFGRCGAQAGDGTPAISGDEQIDRTAGEIARIIFNDYSKPD